MTTKNALEKIEKEFDLIWGIAPEGTPKYKMGEWIKKHYRTALSTLLQQVGEEVKKIVDDMEEQQNWGGDEDEDGSLEAGIIDFEDVRSRLDSVINPLPSEV